MSTPTRVHEHASTVSEPGEVRHPLDPLTAAELTEGRDILVAAGHVGDTTRFPQVLPLEPSKDELATFRTAGSMNRRVAYTLLDIATGESREVAVSLGDGTVVSDRKLATEQYPYGQPQYLFEEYERAEQLAQADERWQRAMHRRGLGEHIDLIAGHVIRIEDSGDVPVPAEYGNYDLATQGPARADLRPIEITQPEGPSFAVDGSSVRWQNWKFRVGFNAREGLVLHRASVPEMVVPYGDTEAACCTDHPTTTEE